MVRRIFIEATLTHHPFQSFSFSIYSDEKLRFKRSIIYISFSFSISFSMLLYDLFPRCFTFHLSWAKRRRIFFNISFSPFYLDPFIHFYSQSFCCARLDQLSVPLKSIFLKIEKRPFCVCTRINKGFPSPKHFKSFHDKKNIFSIL